MASGWTDEDSRIAAEKIIKRAEISKVIQTPWITWKNLSRGFQILQARRYPWIPQFCSTFAYFVDQMLIVDYTAVKITFVLRSRENSGFNVPNHGVIG